MEKPDRQRLGHRKRATDIWRLLRDRDPDTDPERLSERDIRRQV